MAWQLQIKVATISYRNADVPTLEGPSRSDSRPKAMIADKAGIPIILYNFLKMQREFSCVS